MFTGRCTLSRCAAEGGGSGHEGCCCRTKVVTELASVRLACGFFFASYSSLILLSLYLLISVPTPHRRRSPYFVVPVSIPNFYISPLCVRGCAVFLCFPPFSPCRFTVRPESNERVRQSLRVLYSLARGPLSPTLGWAHVFTARGLRCRADLVKDSSKHSAVNSRIGNPRPGWKPGTRPAASHLGRNSCSPYEEDFLD